MGLLINGINEMLFHWDGMDDVARPTLGPAGIALEDAGMQKVIRRTIGRQALVSLN